MSKKVLRISRYELMNIYEAAAAQYERDAETSGANIRVQEGFVRQRDDAKRMRDAIEEADVIEVEG